MSTELLAPAGDIEAGYAAFAYGADAVYLGLSAFSARAEATNFTPESLASIILYAHSIGKRVLVAVNTIFFEKETESLLQTLQIIAESKADGVIVQDIGTARFVKKYFPSVPLHASTQMAVHNRAGVEALRDLGFKRVVLARELTLEEIKDICTVPGIEKEVFIHGALCYSYSGLCLFSAVYTGRSANRGKCVYPCREKFHIEEQNKHPFSMKDLAQSENIIDLVKIGVDALKIEGRKKSPLYVAAVTDYYRSILDGERDKKVLEQKYNTIRSIFSRPTTSLYLKNKNNRRVVDTDIVGHRGLPLGTIDSAGSKNNIRFIRFKTAHRIARYDGIQIDLPNEERPFGFSAERLRVANKDVFEAPTGSVIELTLPPKSPFIPDNAAVYLSSATAVKTAFPYTKPKESEFQPSEDISVFIKLSKTEIEAIAETVKVDIQENLSPAKNPDIVEKSIRDAFGKAGGTGLNPIKIEIDNPQNLFAPMSVLNELRRRLYEQVSADLKEEKQKKNKAFVASVLEENKPLPVKTETPISYLIKTDQPNIFDAFTKDEWDNISEALIEITPDTDPSKINCPDETKLRWVLPTVVRSWEMPALRKKIGTLIADGWKKFSIGNAWGLTALKNKELDFSFDWQMYVANTSAALAALEIGASSFIVSPEAPDAKEIYDIFSDKAVAVIFEDLPLFISETCPYAVLDEKCQNCGGNRQELMDSRYGTFVSVMKNCRHFLLNERPHLKTKEALSLGARKLRLDFTYRHTDTETALQHFKKLTKNG